MQNEDEYLKPFTEKKEAVKCGEYEVKLEKYRDVLYRIRDRSDGLAETEKQIMVAKGLRCRVMEVAHGWRSLGHGKDGKSDPNQLLLVGNASGHH